MQSSEQDAQYCGDPGSIKGHANFLGWGFCSAEERITPKYRDQRFPGVEIPEP